MKDNKYIYILIFILGIVLSYLYGYIFGVFAICIGMAYSAYSKNSIMSYVYIIISVLFQWWLIFKK